jgi:hypothetical protein
VRPRSIVWKWGIISDRSAQVLKWRFENHQQGCGS